MRAMLAAIDALLTLWNAADVRHGYLLLVGSLLILRYGGWVV